QDFTPTNDELKLYDAVSQYLQRPESYALPRGQRSLMTLVLRKILASSSFAIAATLGSLIDRLEALHTRLGGAPEKDVVEAIGEDFEVVAEMQEEWAEREEDVQDLPGESGGLTEEQEKALILKAIRKEADELKSYRGLAASITQNAKGEALLIALKTGLQK